MHALEQPVGQRLRHLAARRPQRGSRSHLDVDSCAGRVGHAAGVATESMHLVAQFDALLQSAPTGDQSPVLSSPLADALAVAWVMTATLRPVPLGARDKTESFSVPASAYR